MNAISVAVFTGLIGWASVQSVSTAEAIKYSEEVIYSFGGLPDGMQPYGDAIDVKSTLYGTTFGGGNNTSGAVFAIDPNSGAENILYSFDEEEGFPEAGLINVNGTLYGTASGINGLGGIVFSFDPDTDEEKQLYAFCSQQNCVDGAFPTASLIDMNGTLYGTTFGGGASGITACNNLGCGTVFSLDPNTGAETVLYSFCGQQNCADGQWPAASMIAVNGMLYGTTEFGAVRGCAEDSGCGVVFSIDPATGTEKTLYSFCSRQNCADGANSSAALIALNGTLYGTTRCGGSHGVATACAGHGYGTVFAINPNTGTEKVIHSFGKDTDGREPEASLIAVKGLLYGTTFGGGGAGCGGSGCGTVFSIDPNTGAEKVLYSFQGGPDGQGPVANLVSAKGTLYGTTSFGGAAGNGTVFLLKKN